MGQKRKKMEFRTSLIETLKFQYNQYCNANEHTTW